MSNTKFQQNIQKILLTSAGLLLSCPLIASAQSSKVPHQLPDRTPGLWQITETELSTAGSKPQVSQHCIDAASDRKLKDIGMAMYSQMACTIKADGKAGGAFVSHQACDMGGIKMDIRMKSEGDFARDFKTTADSITEMAGMPKTTTRTETHQKWVGACKSGQKPGDVIGPDGVTRNLLTGKL